MRRPAGAKKTDYFGKDANAFGHDAVLSGVNNSTVHSTMGGYGSADREYAASDRYGQKFQVGINKDGKIVHLYANGTRVVLNKHPETNHPLYKAAMARVRAAANGTGGAKAP